MPAEVKREVGLLLNRLATSGCEFNRNGTWYTGPDAKGHLQTKLEYLERHQPPQSTEQFIKEAATVSSASGRAYQVRCPQVAEQPSAQWLTQELKALRSGA